MIDAALRDQAQYTHHLAAGQHGRYVRPPFDLAQTTTPPSDPSTLQSSSFMPYHRVSSNGCP